MELRAHAHDWTRRMPDWMAAAIAGFAAGAVLMVLELLWVASSWGASPWQTTHMVAALVMGRGSLESTGFSLDTVLVALLTHYVLGIVFGLVLALLISSFRLDSSRGVVLTAGGVFGAVLYLFNFHAMSYAFGWITDLRGWATFIGHIVFGMTAAGLYWKFEREEYARP